jgi:hypothetical protein
MIEKNNWKKRAVDEDSLLNENVLKFIEELHGKIIKIERHFQIAGMEVDAIIYCRKSKIRRVGIELKDFDIKKAIEQAIERRSYFNYFYIITKSYRRLIGYDIRYLHYSNLLDKFFQNKIGIIVVNNNEPFLLYPSNFIKVGLEKIGIINEDL